MSNPIGLLNPITKYPLMVIKGCVRDIFASLFFYFLFLLKENTCETRKTFFISFQKLFLFLRKSSFGILDIQVS